MKQGISKKLNNFRNYKLLSSWKWRQYHGSDRCMSGSTPTTVRPMIERQRDP